MYFHLKGRVDNQLPNSPKRHYISCVHSAELDLA